MSRLVKIKLRRRTRRSQRELTHRAFDELVARRRAAKKQRAPV